VGRALVDPAEVRECLALDKIDRYSAVARSVFVDREVIGYTVALADATRRPAEYGLPEVERLVEYGASPRGPIGLVQAARVLALLRGRGHVSTADVRDLAADVLRHRLVLSYDALSDGVTADDVVERVLAAVPEPSADHLSLRSAA
jgi:MoxR-like ATPase